MTESIEHGRRTVAGFAVSSRICSLVLAGSAAALLSAGCSSKNYVRSQTAPIVQQTNDLDARTAADHRTIAETDERAQKGVNGAMAAANSADQRAMASGQAADAANRSAQDAYNRVGTLSGVIANLDNYKPLSGRERDLRLRQIGADGERQAGAR